MEDDRPRYPAVCPICGKTLYACKSLLQEMGMNDMGAGSCLQCKTHLHLTFNDETQSMEAVTFEDWANQRRIDEIG